ncbi:hypothetical protein G210_1771, partial [Candida maltosa Xu316]
KRRMYPETMSMPIIYQILLLDGTSPLETEH